jgi:hypothetical protein
MLSRHHQVALLDEQAGRVLTVPTEQGPRLPRLDSRWPDHRDLAAAVGDAAAQPAGPPWREDDGTVTNVLAGDGSSTLEGHGWQPLDDLGPLGLSEETARGLLRTVDERRRSLSRDGGSPPDDDGRAPWFWPGWVREVDVWVEALAAEHGYTRVEEAEIVKIWSLSAVRRYPVERDGVRTDLWFKATCSGFHSEPALTAQVRDIDPAVTPGLLGVDAARAWMLMEPIPDAADETPADLAPGIGLRLAQLQLASLDRREALVGAGAPVRGLEATIEGLHLCVHDSVERSMMSEKLQEDARRIEPVVVDRLRTFWAHGLPETLSHGDLHLGNVSWVEDRPVFFDWTDTCLTHPFLDARHLADSAAETGGPDAHRAVWEAYAEPWRAAHPDLDLDAIWEDSRVPEMVFQMISYEQIYRAQPEVSRWELATIVVEVLGRLVELCTEPAAATPT